MKVILAVALAMMLPAAASAATVFHYDYEAKGKSVGLASGSDNPAGDTYRPGDGFRMTISAGAGYGWTVGSSFTSSFDMAFFVRGSGIRTGEFDLTLRLDGVDVYSFSRGPFTQRFVHMGGQGIRYVEGTVFDEIVLDYTLITSSVSTTIQNSNPAHWGAMFKSKNVSFGSVPDAPTPVPLPASAALLLGALGLLAVKRRRRA